VKLVGSRTTPTASRIAYHADREVVTGHQPPIQCRKPGHRFGGPQSRQQRMRVRVQLSEGRAAPDRKPLDDHTLRGCATSRPESLLLWLIQGANDVRVVQAESDNLVDALRDRGVGVDYLVDEGHDAVNPENVIGMWHAFSRFLGRHLRGRA